MQISVKTVAALVALVSILIWAWRVWNHVWLKPKRQETFLRKQGLKGTSYTFPFGDLKKEVSMMKEAISKPINLTDDISPRIAPFLMQTVKDYGKISYTWVGQRPRVTIMNPQQIKEVTNKVYDFQKPQSHPLVKLLANGVAVYDGEKWAKHRRIISPAFHLEKLKKMVPAFYQSCGEMISKWEKLVSDKGSSAEVDVWPFLVNLTADVISRTAFGSSYDEGRRIFQLQEEQGRLALQAVQTIYIPGWRFVPTKRNKRMKEIDREVKAIIRGIINKRENEKKKAGQAPNDDLLGLLLESNSEQDREQGMSTEDVIEECRLFYFAGQETTAVLLVWTMILLGHHQDWQARARDDVLQLFGQNKPNFDDLNHLKVVTMILYEVLRLFPPGVLLGRGVHKEMKIGDVTLPGGTQIVIPINLVHRDPELWGQDASEFKPERFSDGISKVTKNQVSFLPFGWGPRICVGQNFALTETKMALALILQRFRFELSPAYTHAPYTVLTLQPQFGAHLILHKL